MTSLANLRPVDRTRQPDPILDTLRHALEWLACDPRRTGLDERTCELLDYRIREAIASRRLEKWTTASQPVKPGTR